ncbi:translocase of the inner membrane [Clydaea vesicula]|uniref:Translocase of the inner membrane n=1 Tax=Clydaea vesicula TaxID=447962 RepID=A0AAD5Y2H9_9FUNG|nr:translocase of the inner membrane [Clydaea vesicula]KAJ3392970.1 translocase of the inner membrane [Lobulomyces angularis]
MSRDHSRDPCPYNVVYDVGVGFLMGAVGGTIWHGFKGYRNSPRGERLTGMITTVKVRAPVLGGNFAVWSGLFNSGDCLIAHIRGKEDPWNAILSGFSTGGLLAIRSGTRAMAASAIVGGIILSVMEGVGVMINRLTLDSYKPVAPQLPDLLPQTLPPPPKSKIEKKLDNEISEEQSLQDSSSQINQISSLPLEKPKSRFGFGF